MKNFIVGVLTGFIIGGGLVFAATRNSILQTSNGTAVSASNPLPIQLN